MQIPVHKIGENKLLIKWRDIRIYPNEIETAHRHDYLQMLVLRKVKGIHEIDFENYDSKNYSFHFVGRGRVHKVAFDPKVEGTALHFSEDIFDSSETDRKMFASFTYFTTDSYPILNVDKEGFEALNNIMEHLKKAIVEEKYDTAKYLLFALLAEVREKYNEQSEQNSNKKSSNEMIALNNYLIKHAKRINDLDIFLKENGLTSARINTLCKQEYGKTALQLLQERKLLEVKRLLVYTDMQIKEIAFECGFEDVAYFNRYFKKNLKITPNSFRKNH